MKRKKKKSTAQQQKQEWRHQRNAFFKKLKLIAACFGDASAIDLVHGVELYGMYSCRMRPYRFRNPKNGQRKVSAYNLWLINRVINNFLHNSFVTIKCSKSRINYYDFIMYGITLYLFWHDVDEHSPKIADDFKQSFPSFYDGFTETWADIECRVKEYQIRIGLVISDFKEGVVRFYHEKVDALSPYDLRHFYNNWIVELKMCETELVEIDGNKRSVFKLFINNIKEIAPFCITPERLGIKGLMHAFPLQVFVQQHAINRMEERLNMQFASLSYVGVLFAISSKPVPLKNKRSFLFPLIYYNTKLGYFKGDIIGDKLVIRTFLFLTNNGTPEGKKLGELIGLQKADKKYLGIDNLSTFIFSDIKEDKQLNALFCQAGCGSLFDLEIDFSGASIDKKFTCAQFISKYLGIEENETLG